MSTLTTIAETTSGATAADAGSPVAPVDHEDLQRAREGDHDAYARLHQRYAPLVHGILLAHAPLADVDDAAQEVFLIAWQKLHTLRSDEAFAPWLASVARRTATSFHRWRLRRLARLPGFLRPEGRTHDGHAVPEMLEEIRALPEAYREPLILRLVEQMSGQEIAARTGLTPGSVRVNLHRGMKQLRDRLEDDS